MKQCIVLMGSLLRCCRCVPVLCSTLRRLTVLMVVLCEMIVLRKRQSGMTIISVSVMVLGSFIGGWGDLQFDLYGYSMVLLNNLVTALNLVFIKKTLLDTKLASDTFGVLYYNSVISIPFLLVLVVLSGEIFSLGDYPYWSSLAFQTSFLISACMSFLMNYSTYWCTEVNSALTTSVTGQVKNVLSSFVALSMFGMKATPMLVGGLTVGLSGSMMYAYAVYKTDMARKAAQQAAAGATKGEMAALTAASSSSSSSATHRDGPSSSAGNGGPNGTRTPADMDLSLLTDGVVNGLHTPGPSTSKHSAARYQHEKQDQSSHGDDHLADAKMARLEAGQRSPMISNGSGTSSSGAPLNFPSAISVPSQSGSLKASGGGASSQGSNGIGSLGGGGVPSSPNPLHPYNNPHKSKPN